MRVKSRAVFLGWLLAAALTVIVFVALQLAFHRYLGPYYVPWVSAERWHSAGLFDAVTWTDRVIVILYVALLLVRLIRISGASGLSAPWRTPAVDPVPARGSKAVVRSSQPG